MKKLAFILCFSLLFVLLSPLAVLAAPAPTTRAQFIAAFPATNEQLFGSTNLGDLAAHVAPLGLSIYTYTLSAGSGLFIDDADVTPTSSDDTLVITFSGPNLPRAVCLGLVSIGLVGNYLPGATLEISVNDGAWLPYTTVEAIDDNAFITQNSGGISSIKIRQQAMGMYWSGISYLLVPSKYIQTCPAAPTSDGKTDTMITLEYVSGVEYKMDDGDWQVSPVFTGLSPATEYTFYSRHAETPVLFASVSSAGKAITTNKSAQIAPAAPVVASKTGMSVTLETIAGAEYKVGTGDWQASPIFAGLTPLTEYTFYARMAATTALFASPDSTGTAVTTDKGTQAAPDAPAVYSKSAATVTLETITGAEYKMGDGTWQASPVFTGLQSGTEYTLYARLAETINLFASPASLGTVVTTDKSAQSAPAAPIVASKTGTTVTLNTITGAEYRMGDGAWQASPIFAGLTPLTEYTFYARMAATTVLFASPDSTGTAVTTDKGTQSLPAAPTIASRTTTAITLEAIPGAEYRMGDGAWQASPVFTGLQPGTEYTFYIRLAETPVALASQANVAQKVTTLPAADIPATGEHQPLWPLALIGMMLAATIAAQRKVAGKIRNI